MTELSSVFLIHDHVGFPVPCRPSSRRRLNDVSGEDIGLDRVIRRMVRLLLRRRNPEAHRVDLVREVSVFTVTVRCC